MLVSHAQTALAPANQEVNLAALEEVVVTGERTGPRMWRVAKNGHVLWLLGTPGALPKDVTWQSQDVEAVIADSQQVLDDARMKVTPGLFSMVSLYFQYRRTVKLPSGETLANWLSPDTYRLFGELAQRYAPSEDLQHYRPLYVAEKLWRGARGRSGVNERINVAAQVVKLAKQHNVEVASAMLKLDDPAQTLREMLKELAALPREQEVACLTATMNSLNDEVSAMKARANAWALGDVASLRALQNRARQVCWEVLSSSPKIKALSQQMREYWLHRATTALENNQSTLALRPIEDLLGADGVLSQFRAAGYVVEGP